MPTWRSLHRTYYTDFEDVDHTLDSGCSCPYSEACYTDAVEEQDIRLLGIPPAQQQVFRSHGIETVGDVADLAYPPDKRDMTHHHSVKPKDKHLWKTLLLETNLTGAYPNSLSEPRSSVGNSTVTQPLSTPRNTLKNSSRRGIRPSPMTTLR